MNHVDKTTNIKSLNSFITETNTQMCYHHLLNSKYDKPPRMHFIASPDDKANPKEMYKQQKSKEKRRRKLEFIENSSLAH